MADELAVLSDLTTAMDRLDPDGRRRALAYLADRYGDPAQFGFSAPSLITERSDPAYVGRPEVDLRGTDA